MSFSQDNISEPREYGAIPGFSKYRVSLNGTVDSFRRGSWIRLRLTKNWATPDLCYHRTTLRRDDGRLVSLRLHTIMLLAFVGPPPAPGMHCRHLNGDSTDNRLENLCWGTAKENCGDTLRTGRRRNARGEECGGAILTEKEVIELRNAYLRGETGSVLGERFGVSKQAAWEAAIGRAWSYIPAILRPPLRSLLSPEQKHGIVLLKALGFDQYAIARMAGVHQCTVSRIVNGRRRSRKQPD